MALDQRHLKRRIEAARILRGRSQVDLGRLFQADGLGRHDPGRLERGEIEMQRVHLDALARHLEMPEWWFTADRIVLGAGQVPGVLARLDAIMRHLGIDLPKNPGLHGDPAQAADEDEAATEDLANDAKLDSSE